MSKNSILSKVRAEVLKKNKKEVDGKDSVIKAALNIEITLK